MINNNKKDRRIEKTEYVLVNSLAALMHSKNIKDISVKELCEYANVNRGTFYLHYNDIYDMLDTIENTLIIPVWSHYLPADKMLYPDLPEPYLYIKHYK